MAVAEWTCNQLRGRPVQVLLALGRLVTALLRMPQERVAKSGTQLLALGAGVGGYGVGWVVCAGGWKMV